METPHNTYAINTHGACVKAGWTSKEEKPFECLLCKQPVFLRAGEHNRPHFAHHKDGCTRIGGGGGESEEHAAAKRLIRDNIERIQIYVTCGYKGCTNESDLWESCLFLKGHCAEEEVGVGGGYRVDICVKESGTGEIKAVIEVMHTHAVQPEKLAALYELLIDKRYVVEIRALDVLAYLESEDDVPIWRLANRLTHRHCDGCFLKIKQEALRKLRNQ